MSESCLAVIASAERLLRAGHGALPCRGPAGELEVIGNPGYSLGRPQGFPGKTSDL